jgi:hypothetical protein
MARQARSVVAILMRLNPHAMLLTLEIIYGHLENSRLCGYRSMRLIYLSALSFRAVIAADNYSKCPCVTF